jgi:DNA-binding beta-propeller fold protein YncE
MGISSFCASTVSVGALPQAVAVNESEGVLYVANTGADSVTFLDASTGAYTYGGYYASSFQVETEPTGLAVDASRNRLYVSGGAGGVTYLDDTSGAYINGALAASTFSVGTEARSVAANSLLGLVYATTGDDETVVYLDGTNGAYINGTLETSRVIVTPWTAADVAVNPSIGRVYVALQSYSPGQLATLDAATPASIGVSYGRADGVIADETSGLVYGGGAPCCSDGEIAEFDGTTGVRLRYFDTDASLWNLALNPLTGVLYGGGYWGVYSIDVATGAYVNGSAQNSSIYGPGGANYTGNGMAIDLGADRLYVANSLAGSVTYFTASTATPINPGVVSDVWFPTAPDPSAIAVMPQRE